MILSKITDLAKKQTTSMEEYAEKIAKNAYNYSLNKYYYKTLLFKLLLFFFARNYVSPFEIRAKQHGYLFRGGKSDDITIIVAKVEETQ